ncbi:MAG TPA: hypothetical protein ENK06_09975 [Gammaproteobacteria bacterium]|nr:hypothetical protein [Gammaproteobacteria bacterium]
MKLLVFLKCLFAIAVIAFLASCSCSSNAPLRDLEIPKITSTTPSSSSKNAVINTFINVTFSEKMDGSSINQNTFQLFDSSGKRVDGEIATTATSATLKPAQSLNKTSRYTVKISRDVKDLAGNQIIANYFWEFTTGIKADETNPEVDGIFPAPESQNIPLDSNIVASLNTPVSATSVTSDSFMVADIEGNRVNGSLSVNGSDITFEPEQDLDFKTQYDITLTSDIQDMAGNGLTTAYTSRFTTLESSDEEPPLVTSVSPANKTINVPLNANIIISFNEAMGASTVNSTYLRLKGPNGEQISATETAVESNVIIQPAALLSPATVYTMTILPGMEDLAGNKLENEFRWQFTTGNDEDTGGPTITLINPESGATEVPTNNAITVTFSEAINPATLNENISLTNSRGNVAIRISYSGNTAILRPNAIMKSEDEHTVSLLNNITDLSNNPMLNNYSWRFTTGTTIDRNIPSVTSVYPANEATNIATNTAIVTRFSEAIDPFSIHSNSFIVSNESGETIAGNLKTVGASVTFHPLESLAFSTRYTVTINKQATDLATNALREVYTWHFTTSTENDTIKPTISSTVPASASNYAPINRGVIVVFSETMDLSTINSTSFYLTDTNGTRIDGSINYAGDSITLMPDNDLDFSKSYIATVTADVADMAGNTLGLVHSWPFTTGAKTDLLPPEVTSTIPLDGNPTIVSFPVTINFDKNMDPVSLNTATLLLRDDAGTAISGTVSTTPSSAIFLPRSDLNYDTQYTMTVTTGVRDISKIHLQTDYSWNFRTSEEPSKAPPFVISVSPAPGEAKVRLTSSLNVIFSEPIDCTTVTSDSFTLINASNPVAGTISCDAANKTASFTPNEALATDSNYQASLSSDIKDFDAISKNLSPVYSWQFSTAPWTQQFGTVAPDAGQAIAIDADDNVYTAGNTGGSLASLNPGVDNDIFITKHSKHSLLLWSKQLGSKDADNITDLVIDAANNLYLTGYSYGDFSGTNNGGADIIVLKLDSDGNLIWQKQIGAEQDDIATAIQLDANNDLIIAGYSDTDFNGNNSSGLKDIIVMKMTTDGTQTWSQQFGTFTLDFANDVATDSENNIYITGYTEGDFGTGNAGLTDIFLSKLDSSNTIQWTRQIGSSLDDQARALAIDSSDNIYITGFSNGSLNSNTAFGGSDQFILKYDKDGVLLDSAQMGTSADDQAYGMVIDDNDNILLTGYSNGDLSGTSAGNSDLTIIKMTSNITTLWRQQYGSEGIDLGFAMTRDSNNNLYVTGSSDGELDSNVNAGDDDTIIMKWNKDGIKQ